MDSGTVTIITTLFTALVSLNGVLIAVLRSRATQAEARADRYESIMMAREREEEENANTIRKALEEHGRILEGRDQRSSDYGGYDHEAH